MVIWGLPWYVYAVTGLLITLILMRIVFYPVKEKTEYDLFEEVIDQMEPGDARDFDYDPGYNLTVYEWRHKKWFSIEYQVERLDLEDKWRLTLTRKDKRRS